MTREQAMEHQRWQLVCKEARAAGIEPNDAKFIVLFKSIGMWGEALSMLRASQDDDTRINAQADSLIRYNIARRHARAGDVDMVGAGYQPRAYPNGRWS